MSQQPRPVKHYKPTSWFACILPCLFGVAAVACSGGNERSTEMLLTAVRAWTVPELGTISGGSFTADTIILWRREDPIIARLTGDSLRMYDVHGHEPVFAFINDGALEFIDGGTGYFHRVDAHGDVQILPYGFGGGDIITAARSGASWIIMRALSTTAPEASIEIWRYGSEPELTATIPTNDYAWVSGSPLGRFVTVSLNRPFRVSLLDEGGKAEAIHTVETWLHRGLPDSDSARWFASVPVWLDAEHVLLTFMDVTSDNRLLVRTHVSSGIFTTRHFDVPLAFIASDPSRHRAIAFRDTYGGELVLYTWQ